VRALDALQAKLSRPRSPGFWALDASIDVFIDHAPPDRFAQFPLAIPLEEDAPVALVPRSGARERDLLRPRYLIGRSMVESTALPPAWPSALAPLNEVWLPARFLVPVFAAAGGASERLFVLREAIDTEVFDPQRVQPLPWVRCDSCSSSSSSLSISVIAALTRAQLVREARGRFVFLSSFRWQLRKGWDLLFRAYLEEFRGERDTLLVVLAARDAGAEAELQGSLAELLAHPDAVRRIPTCLHSTLAALTRAPPRAARAPAHHRRAVHARDAALIPQRRRVCAADTRRGLGPACGRGHGDGAAYHCHVLERSHRVHGRGVRAWRRVRVCRLRWCKREPHAARAQSNSFPVPIEGLVPTPAGSLHFGSWAAPSLPALRRHMRRVFADRVEARRRGARARATMVARFSRPAISDALRARLAQLRTALRD
jgi:hypothetical protein